MPELPEVETVARDLRRHLLPEGGGPGPEIVGARVSWARTLRDGDEAGFTVGVTGRRIETVGRRGKQLVIELSGGAFLTVHLKMTGQLFVVPASLPRDPYERFALELADGRELRFRDIRKFGRLGLYSADDDPFDATGPEPLDPRFTLREFRARVRGRRARLKTLLVDQAFIAGVGNIYADEALWRARVHPLRPAGELSEDEVRRVHRGVRAALRAGIARRGATLRDYRTPDGGSGAMQDEFRVYGRGGEPCERCGTPIDKIRVAGRGTWYCPGCQPRPGL